MSFKLKVELYYLLDSIFICNEGDLCLLSGDTNV